MKNLKELALRARNRLLGDTIKTTNDNIKIIINEDELFKEKVREVLIKETISPMSDLMDQKLLMKLAPDKREKYLLETVEKFIKFKKEIEASASKLVF